MNPQFGQEGEDTIGGMWLIRKGGMLLGPVPGQVIVDQLEKGELTPATQVADEDDEQWMEIREVPAFSAYIARAEARQKVMAEKASSEAEAKARGRTFLMAGIIAGVCVLGGVAYGAWYYVTNNAPGVDADELADIDITIPPPVIALASDSAHFDEEDYLDVETPDTDDGEAVAAANKGGSKGTTKGRRPKGGTKGGTKGKTPTKEPAGTGEAAALATATDKPVKDNDVATHKAYDMDKITKKARGFYKSLFGCIKQEVARSGFKGKIEFEFVIKNDGRVGKLWLDTKQLRGSPMEGCFNKQMSSWKFDSFPGERPSIKQSFTIG